MQETFNRSKDDVFDKCLKALSILGFEVKYQNRKDGIIGASTGVSIFSWGESIDIQISRIAPKSTTIGITSTSHSQLFSWGKNEDNERKVIETLSEIINSK